MKAIEFQSTVHDGMIADSESSGLKEGQIVRVLILGDESEGVPEPAGGIWDDIWTRIEESWKGEPLVRESQGK